MNDYRNVTKDDFEKYMKATNGKKSYSVDECIISGLGPNKFIYIADNLDYFKNIFGGIVNAK